MTRGQFLCGCWPTDKRGYYGNIVKDAFGNDIYTDKRFDSQGFEVCPEHGERLYGWASPTVQSPQGNEVLDYASKSNATIKKLDLDIEDRRDNRDPILIGKRIQAKSKKADCNGHK